jgi:hypothetical protein
VEKGLGGADVVEGDHRINSRVPCTA